ncbi:MAG: PH domain-containing protein [Ilumatobacter sp.]|uniref:PH domain-containing protein n=1 Tax=Ilumatobacter sp. TaxID=1967498 RepID=UPI00391BBC83
MPYPRRLLNDHEEVAVDLHPHWWYYAKAVSGVVAAVGLAVATLVLTEPETAPRLVLGWVSLVALLASIVWLVGRYAKWATTNIVLTSHRLIYRVGVVAKRGVEIPLERVNTVHFSQSIFERLLGAGDLVIESGGEDGQQRFTDVRRPDRLQRQLHAQMELNQQRRFSAVAGSIGSGDVATQLEKLEGLLERGTLSREEFDAHKARLLGR